MVISWLVIFDCIMMMLVFYCGYIVSMCNSIGIVILYGKFVIKVVGFVLGMILMLRVLDRMIFNFLVVFGICLVMVLGSWLVNILLILMVMIFVLVFNSFKVSEFSLGLILIIWFVVFICVREIIWCIVLVLWMKFCL